MVSKKEIAKAKISVEVYNPEGKVIESISLPESVFGGKVNLPLIAQAVRVYLANQREGNASTKTRGQVRGSTRKIYRQKGTGRARHGGVRAPIFVHGGIAHGPKPHDYSLSMPKQMRRAAMRSLLTKKWLDGEIKVISGFDKLEPKTKIMAQALTKLAPSGKKQKTLVVFPEKVDSLSRSMRNLPFVEHLLLSHLHIFVVAKATQLIFLKETVAKMEAVLGRKENHG